MPEIPQVGFIRDTSLRKLNARENEAGNLHSKYDCNAGELKQELMGSDAMSMR